MGTELSYANALRPATGSAPPALRCSELLSAVVESDKDSTPRSLPGQQREEDIVRFLDDAGFPAMLQGRELISAVRLACKRMANAVQQQHCTLRVVLPSASHGRSLPEPEWLANLQVNIMLAARRVHIVSCSHFHSAPKSKRHGPPPIQHAECICNYATALSSALSADGQTGLPATSLVISVSKLKAAVGIDTDARTGVAAVLPELTPLLPQLQSVCINSVRPLHYDHLQTMIVSLGTCPEVHTFQINDGSGTAPGIWKAAMQLPKLCPCLRGS